MRLYSVLLVSAVALIASTASASDCDAGTYPPEASVDSSSVDDTSSQAAPGIVQGYPTDSSTGSDDDNSATSTSGVDDTTSGFGDVTQYSTAASASSASTSGSNDVVQTSSSASGFDDVTQSSTTTSTSGSNGAIQTSSASGVDASASSNTDTSNPDDKWGKDDANLPSSDASNVDASAASTSGSNDVIQYSTAAPAIPATYPSSAASSVDASAASTSNFGDVPQSSNAGSYPDEDGNKWGKDDANLPSSAASNVDASAASTSNFGDVTQSSTSGFGDVTQSADVGFYPDEDSNKWGKDEPDFPSSAASNVDASAASTSSFRDVTQSSTSGFGDVTQSADVGFYPDEDSNKWGKDGLDFPSSAASNVDASAASTSGSNDVIQYSTAAPTIPATYPSSAASNVDASAASTSNVGDVTQSSSSDADEITQTAVDGDDDASNVSITGAPFASSSGSSSTAAQTTQLTDAPSVTTRTPIAVSTSGSSSAAAIQSNSTTAAPATTSPASSSAGFCAKPRVRITDVDVGATVENNEDEAALKVVAIAALPSGGSRIAFQSGDSIIVRELDANDELVSSSPTVKVPLNDFADLHADKDGFVILGTRDAEGGGTLNCGNPSNLCGTAPNPAVPCYDMYMVRYDGSKESWATKLTSSSASLPPYSSSKTGPDVYMIWWYAHHGRIAFDGKNWAAYFGAAISTSEGGCINIHQGDRMKVVNPSGTITADSDSFDWGCSHSAYERITYDNRTDSYATICKTDSNNRIMPPNNWDATIYPVDLAAANLGDIVPDGSASSKKYWATVSNGDGDNAAVHLIHFALDAKASEDIKLGGTDANERAPHLAPIGDGGMLAMWEGSSSGGDLTEGGERTIYAQVLDTSTGKAISEKVTVDKSVVGNRYQALKTYSDGSVAYLSKGTTDTSVQVVRFFGC